MGIANCKSFTEGIQGIAFTREHLARVDECVNHIAGMGSKRGSFEKGKLTIQEAQIKRCIVNNQLSISNKLNQIFRDLCKDGFIRSKGAREAMYSIGARIDVALWLDVLVKGALS